LKHLLFAKEGELFEANNIIKMLEDKVKALSAELGAERKEFNDFRAQTTLGTPPFLHRSDGGRVGNTPSGPVSPVTTRTGRSFSQLSTVAQPYTPVTPTTPRFLIGPVVNGATGQTTGRRHKRTETPEQLFLRPYTNGVPIFTWGIDPQGDRGLIHDFFDDIRNWAAMHSRPFAIDEVDNLASHPSLVDMMGGKSIIQDLLLDDEMRKDIVAAIVARHIVVHAVGEAFLTNSKHRAGQETRDIFTKFALLAENDYKAKHELCVRQGDLYKSLKIGPGHKKWRTGKAEELTVALLTLLTPFLGAAEDANRDHVLSELYVKGYRIGFRLHMEEAKWQIIYPVAGMNLNLERMVNQTRTLLGDPMTTFNKLMQNPRSFFVRFAITPTFTRSDFSSGREVKTVVHSSMVHIGRMGKMSHLDDVQY